VSHAPERKEKDCLNCGATVIGRFCHVCGQENIVPKESFGSLVIHFFYDITHFDGKFFYSLKYLLFRPGFLSKEYVRGKRVTYLNPVRMYVFTSAIFFLLFFLLINPKQFFNTNINDPLTQKERTEFLKEFEKEYKKQESDTTFLVSQMQKLKDTTKRLTREDLSGGTGSFVFNGQKKYKTVAEYNSAQKKLDPSQRDGFFMRTLQKKQIKLSQKYAGKSDRVLDDMSEIFLHKLPYLLFISLPFFALFLKLSYVRRKQFYYADHAIFAIHHYVFSFIILLFIFLLGSIRTKPGLQWLLNLEVALIVLWPVYLYLAMLNFYKQNWFKTFIKFILLNILGSLSLLLLFIIFLFLSIFEL
jgi:hypothetical protein